MGSGDIRDRDWVAAQLAAGLTVVDLAAAADVSRPTATNWIARHGLKTPTRAKPRPTDAQLAALYRRAGSVAGVAAELDVTPQTAHRWLHGAGVELAGRHGRRRLDNNAIHHERAAGLTIAEIAKRHGVAQSTILRRLKEPSAPADGE
jgi:transposase-like protein